MAPAKSKRAATTIKSPRRPAPARKSSRQATTTWAFVSDLGLSKKQLAETIGLRPEALYKSQRAGAAKTQTRLREMLEIIGRVSAWAGGKEQAMAWYRAQPIPEFGGRTAESLVKSGQAGALRDYLDHFAMGGFA
jgi:hypothetical protein